MFISDFQDSSLGGGGDSEICIKVVIVGNGAVGKSSMIQRYCRGVFTKGYKKTIGVDFLEKQLRVLSENVRLMLWDTAGQEEYDAITKAYYRGAQACVVAFSTTDRSSFEAVRRWKRKVEDEVGSASMPMVLVQNKVDLMGDSVVTDDEVSSLARDCGMRLYQTSAKENLNVCNVFLHLAENYVNQAKTRAAEAAAMHSSRLLIGGGAPSNPSSKRKQHRTSMTAEEYLSHPMFDSLSSSSSSSSSSSTGGGASSIVGGIRRRMTSGFGGQSGYNFHHQNPNHSHHHHLSPWGGPPPDRGTIVLKPLSHLKKKQRSLSMRLEDTAAMCKVL